MNHDLPPLDDELRRMLSKARDGVPVPEGAEARVRSLLATSLPSVAPALQARSPARARLEGIRELDRAAGSLASAGSIGGFKVVAAVVGAFLAGGVGGASLHAWLAGSDAARRDHVEAPVAPAPTTSTSTALEATPPLREVSAPEPRTEVPSSGESASDLGAERALLDRARRAFGEGNPVASLTAIAAHARRFPSGRLQEEREALAVKALVAAARYGEARTRADKFRSRYPDSISLPSVASAVQQIP